MLSKSYRSSHSQPRIVYTGLFRFPVGDASASYLLNVGKALREGGFEVEFAPGGNEGRQQDLLDDGTYAYEGFRYYPQSEFRCGPVTALRRLMRYVSVGTNTLNWVKQRDHTGLKAVFLYGGMTSFHARLAPYCRGLGVPLIPHCVEWFEPGHCVGGRFGLYRWDVELTMRLLNKRYGHILCISSFLERYYADRNCHALRRPPLIDLSAFVKTEVTQGSSFGRTVRIVFAGSPDRERWDVILQGFVEARRKGAEVRLEILGTEKSQWMSIIGPCQEIVKELEASLHFHGRVPTSAVPGIMANSDAAIIVRDDARWSNACFPMKVPELLAHGVPLVGTATGDMTRYLQNRRNALLISTPNSHELALRLADAWRLKQDEWGKMRVAARDSASAFDYRNHIDALGNFVNHAWEKTRG